MCGITGYYTKGNGKLYLDSLLVNSQVRGRDATGVAFVKDGEIVYVKSPMDATEFIKEKHYTHFIGGEYNPTISIGHTRAFTKGRPSNNLNNHPLISDLGFALIHNGVITNDDALFEEFKLERQGEVDSEVILRLIEYYLLKKDDMVEAIKSAISKLRGSIAIAVIDAHRPDELYLARTSNPISLAYKKSTGDIFFASTEKILEESLAGYKVYAKFFVEEDASDLIIQDLKMDTGVVIDKEGITPFQVSSAPYTPTHQPVNYRQSCMLPEKTETSPDEPITKPWKATDMQLLDRIDRINERLMEKDYKSKKERKRLEKELKKISDSFENRVVLSDEKETPLAEL